ncbi:hypothetical protein [uncultured Planococcus sp.]|uniref:hypothetical protein n=1 Tax=uncultured Planococcus sp. TaxID=337815 RepID=UPI002610A6D1|nr:hypothetical protein [uncultured Planococcus sp.]
MTIKWESALLDADFTFKMGKLDQEKIIVTHVGALIEKIYIHRHIYEKEILTPQSVRNQIDELLENGKAEIVDLSTLPTQVEKVLYQDMITLLKETDPSTRENGKNWGETVSLAYAKANNIPYFLSDESTLQSIADEYLNSGNEQDIKVIRVKDFILALKEAGYKRKECKKIWLVATFDPSRKIESREQAKKAFDEEIWPQD